MSVLEVVVTETPALSVVAVGIVFGVQDMGDAGARVRSSGVVSTMLMCCSRVKYSSEGVRLGFVSGELDPRSILPSLQVRVATWQIRVKQLRS